MKILVFLFFFFLFAISVSFAGDVAIIVNNENSTDAISSKNLVKIFRQEIQYWKDGKKIYLTMQETGSRGKAIVLEKIYKMNAVSLKKFWISKMFKGEITSFVKTFGSNEVVRRFVGQVTNAVGFIDVGFLDNSVKALKIDGKFPGERGYFLCDRC